LAEFLHRQLAELLMDFERYGDALAQLEFLLGHSPDGADLHLLLAKCHEADGNPRQAIHRYRSAIRLEPRNNEAYQLLSRLFREAMQHPDEADRVIDEMVSQNHDSSQVYLIRARYNRRFGRWKEALIDSQRAYQFAPNSAEGLVFVVDLLADGKDDHRSVPGRYFDGNTIRAQIEKLLRQDPRHLKLLQAAATLEWIDGRLESAERRLRQVITIDADNLDLSALLIEVLIAQGRSAAAQQELVELRRRNAPDSTVSYFEARLLMADGKWLAASRMLESIRLAPLSPATHRKLNMDLGRCYAQLGDLQRRLDVLRRAVGADRFSSAARIEYAAALADAGRVRAALAQYQQVPDSGESSIDAGRLSAAESQYRSALDSQPDNSGVLLKVARLFRANPDARQTESLYRKVISLESKAAVKDLAAARRALAILLAERGNYRDLQEALSLVEQNLDTNSNDVDWHVKARLLASSSHGDHRRDAITILERFGRRRPLGNSELRTLVTLNLALKRWPQARDSLFMLMVGHGDDPDNLAFGVRTMLEHGEFYGVGKQWLQALSKLQPAAIQTVELRAWELVVENRVNEAIDLFKEPLAASALDSRRSVALIAQVANLLVDLADRRELAGRSAVAETLYSEAERLYRLNAQTEPQQILALMRFLAARGRIDDAFALFDTAWKAGGPEQASGPESVAAVCVDMLRRGRVDEKHFRMVRTRLQQATYQFPDSAVLLFHAGNISQLDGDYDSAFALYRAAVAKDRELTAAHNELALLLTLHSGAPDESLRWIDRAIDVSGPIPYLLDTRALAYLKLDRFEDAINDLERAIADGSTPARQFHLARALAASGAEPSARATLQQAISDGLQDDLLHPLERQAFRDLRSRLIGKAVKPVVTSSTR
jgi:tetratricopeptide (TPR) repeat protein